MAHTRHADTLQNELISVMWVSKDSEHQKLRLSRGQLCYVADMNKICLHDGITYGGVLCIGLNGPMPMDVRLATIGALDTGTWTVSFQLTDGTIIHQDMSGLRDAILAMVHPEATLASVSAAIPVTWNLVSQSGTVGFDPAMATQAILGSAISVNLLKAALDTDEQTAAEVPVNPTVAGANNVQDALTALAAGQHPPATVVSGTSAIPVVWDGSTQFGTVGFAPAPAALALAGSPAAVGTLKAVLDTDDQTAAEVPVSPAVLGQINVQAALEAMATSNHPAAALSAANSGVDVVFNAASQIGTVGLNAANTATLLVSTPAALNTLQTALDTDDQTATEVPVGPPVMGQNNVQAALGALAAAQHPAANITAANTTMQVVWNNATQVGTLAVDPYNTASAMVGDIPTLAVLKAAIDTDTDDQTATEVVVAPAVLGQVNVQAALGALAAASHPAAAITSPDNTITVGGGGAGQAFTVVARAATAALSGVASLAVAAEYPSASDTEVATPAYVTAAIAAIPPGHAAAAIASADGSVAVGTVGQNFDLSVPMATGAAAGRVELANVATYNGVNDTDAVTPAALEARLALLIPPVPPVVRAAKVGTQTIVPAVWNKLTFANELQDTENVYNTATSRATFTRPGLYDVRAYATFANNVDNPTTGIRVYKNGVFDWAGSQSGAVSNGSAQVVAGIISIAANDYVEIFGYKGVSATTDYTVTAGELATLFIRP